MRKKNKTELPYIDKETGELTEKVYEEVACFKIPPEYMQYFPKDKLVEIMSNVGSFDYGDRHITKESLEYLDETEEIGKNMGFAKVFNYALEEFMKMNIPNNQWKVIHCVARYFRYDSGLVSYDNGVPLSVADIAKLTDLGERAVYEAIDKLVEKNIIAKTKNKHNIKYFVNPYLFMRGVRANKTWTALFSDTAWKNNYDVEQSRCENKTKRSVSPKKFT